MSFIHVKGLRAGYGKSVVLRDIDLDIDEGESVAVVARTAPANRRCCCRSSAARQSAAAASRSAASRCRSCRPTARRWRA
jgi:ABC-type arginine transport system ATPase subunit